MISGPDSSNLVNEVAGAEVDRLLEFPVTDDSPFVKYLPIVSRCSRTAVRRGPSYFRPSRRLCAVVRLPLTREIADGCRHWCSLAVSILSFRSAIQAGLGAGGLQFLRPIRDVGSEIVGIPASPARLRPARNWDSQSNQGWNGLATPQKASPEASDAKPPGTDT